MTEEHPYAALTRRVFAAFGRDPKVIAAALARDVVWRVPGSTVMSGEYRGTREVVEFLRRTGTETDGTYRSRLHTVLADDCPFVAQADHFQNEIAVFVGPGG